MRLVLDTNILISACWSPGGLEAELIRRTLSGEFTWCVTEEVLAEYRDVARRPKFADRAECFRQMLADLAQAVLVTPGPRVAAAADEDDNRLLECATGARADWLITGNLRHFPVVWQGTRIANARQFFTEALGRPPRESPSAGP